MNFNYQSTQILNDEFYFLKINYKKRQKKTWVTGLTCKTHDLNYKTEITLKKVKKINNEANL
jgi:hypothetical protein